MPNRTLRQVITGQTLVTARRDTSVRAAAVAMAEPGDGKPLGAGVDVGGAGKWLCHVDVHVQ